MGQEVDEDAHWYPTIVADGPAKARVITSGPDQDIEKIEVSMLQAIACAQASIYVMTPYFLSDDKLLSALALAAMRGVSVHVVIPERSNHWYVDFATRANIGVAPQGWRQCLARAAGRSGTPRPWWSTADGP